LLVGVLSDESYEMELDEESELHMAVLTRWFKEGWGKRNFDLVDELFSPEFIAEGGIAGKLDRLAYKAYCKRVIEVSPDMNSVILELIPAQEIIVSRVRSTGTHGGSAQGVKATGSHYDTIIIDVWKFKDGLIVKRENANIDAAHLREVLGASPRYEAD
jgi:predicted ester cyclase